MGGTGGSEGNDDRGRQNVSLTGSGDLMVGLIDDTVLTSDNGKG